MRKKNNLKICLTPDNFSNYHISDHTLVVVVDLLRATTVISTAFHYGIKEIIPVQGVDKAREYFGKENHIVAAERNAMALEGFDYGNSPFQYMNDNIKGKNLVLTTTNGTHAINIARKYKVITASFINIDAVLDFLISSSKDVLILCSGWKGVFNLEDSLFAGCLANRLLLSTYFETNCDSVLASSRLYHQSKDNMFNYLSESAHRKRLKSLNMERDTKFCLTPTIKSSIIPTLIGEKLVRA